MTRDNVLFIVIGLLTGFISGYFLHEVMAARQPPPAGTAAAAADLPQTPAGEPNAEAPMQQILELRDYVEANPEDAEATLVLANLNYDIRNWERARDLYQRVLELGPPDPDVITDLGVCFRELGEYEEALERFRRAQELSDSHWQSLYNEAVVLAFDLERYEDAERIVDRLRRLQPDNERVERLATEIDRRS